MVHPGKWLQTRGTRGDAAPALSSRSFGLHIWATRFGHLVLVSHVVACVRNNKYHVTPSSEMSSHHTHAQHTLLVHYPLL